MEPDVEVPGAVGDGQVLPDELLSVADLPEVIDRLTPAQKRVPSREEFASIVETGVPTSCTKWGRRPATRVSSCGCSPRSGPRHRTRSITGSCARSSESSCPSSCRCRPSSAFLTGHDVGRAHRFSLSDVPVNRPPRAWGTPRAAIRCDPFGHVQHLVPVASGPPGYLKKGERALVSEFIAVTPHILRQGWPCIKPSASSSTQAT